MDVTHVIDLEERPGHAPFAGAETHLFTLMAAQAAAGQDVEFAPMVVAAGPAFQAKFAELKDKGVRVSPQPTGGPFRWNRNLGLIRSLRPFFAARRDRAIHTHLDNADYIGRVSAWSAGCRALVSSNHNNEPYYATAYWKAKLRLLDRCNREYIAISDLIRDYLIGTVGLPAGKITTIHYGIHPPARPADPAALRGSLGIPADAFVVGFVGRLEPQKNVPLLLEAARSVPEARVVIVGGGSLEADLKVRAQANPPGQVLFTGYRADAADLMPAFDLFCLPSDWEGLGLVLLEAMARGVPVAGSRAGAIPEILADGRCGLLFPPKDAASLAALLRRAMADREALRDLSRSGLARVRADFTVGTMVRRTDEIYRRASTGKAGGA
jgi:glycosyltransferase involved in cell wall biosynthesis